MIKKIFIALIGFFLLIVFYFTYAIIINPKSPKGYVKNYVEDYIGNPLSKKFEAIPIPN